MSDDYDVGITLVLEDGISVGVAAIQRDLLQLDQAIAQSAAGLAELRAVASLAFADANADVRRAARLTAAPASQPATRPKVEPEAEAEAMSAEAPAAPAVARTVMPVSVAVAAVAMERAIAPAPTLRPATKDEEAGNKTPPPVPLVVPVTVARPAASRNEPAQRDGVVTPAAPSLPMINEAARETPASIAAAMSMAPGALVASAAPLARTEVPIAPAPEARSAVKPIAPTAPTHSSEPSLAPPATPVAMLAPAASVVIPPPAAPIVVPPMATAPLPLQQRSAASVQAAERVTTRDMPRMPELAVIGRSVMPSRPVEVLPAATQEARIGLSRQDHAVPRPGLELPVHKGREEARDGRRSGAPRDHESHVRTVRNEPITTAMPAVHAPVPPAASTNQQLMTGGDVIFDGQKVGRWMSDRMTRDAGRPPNGPTGFDPSRSPAWPGATVA